MEVKVLNEVSILRIELRGNLLSNQLKLKVKNNLINLSSLIVRLGMAVIVQQLRENEREI